MRYLIAGLLLIGSAAFVGHAHAQTIPTCPVQKGMCGISVPASGAVTVVSSIAAGFRIYQMILNSGPTTGGVAWCSRGGTPSVNGAGSIALAPVGNALGEASFQEFGTGTAGATSNSQGATYVPQMATICISDGGSSGTAAAILTVELQ